MIQDSRARAVAALIARVRTLSAGAQLTRATLEQFKVELIALASRSELFPVEHFANPAGRTGTIYHLAEDADGGYALYGSAGSPGKAQPPHNHTTWAAIAGVYGEEHNAFFERIDQGEVPGEGRLRLRDELTIRRGNACAMLPGDFHSIEVRGKSESLHLHLYGRTLEDLPERVGFATSTGGKLTRFMAKPEIYCPRITAEELRELVAGGEILLLDVRDGAAPYGLAVPLAQLEERIAAIAPGLATRIALVDDNEALAQRAAVVLRRLGYRDLHVLAGGAAQNSASS